MTELPRGFGYAMQGLRLITRPRLRRFVIIPLLVNLILFAGLGYLAYAGFQDLMDYLLGFLPGWLEWLKYILWPLFALTVLVVMFYSFSLLANLIAAPFNGLLAEAVEKFLTGQDLPGGESWKQMLKEVIPSLIAELQKLKYFILWAIPFGILFLIPGMQPVAPVLWALYSAWMLALEYLDFPLGNHGMLFPAQRKRARQHRFLTLGFGLGAMLLAMIPLLNFIAMPATVAGATVMWVKRVDDSQSA